MAGHQHIAVGVDIGGTFTDVILLDETGRRLRSAKVLTTPTHPERGVLEAIAAVLAQAGAGHDAARTIVHGTTLATNAIIERKGAATGLLTTRGFRDVLETARELRYDLYDLFIDFPVPLVPRRHRLGISERVRYDGEVLAPLDEGELRAGLASLVEAGVESVAVCFLHAYANPANEDAAARVVASAHPELAVSLSSRVLPEIGEYGRVSTTVANAYVQPLVARYLGDLDAALAARGSRAGFFVMSSSGGTLSLEHAREFPVRLVESGPAAGVAIAAHYAERLALPNVLAFDMGGTTAKISLITGGEPTRAAELEVARVRRFQKGSGLLLRAPAVDLIEIGAGGGSIAAVDGLGLIAVGPESAGAEPGPACYALGGEAATVTDADLVLGYLNPEYFLGGAMRLDRERAHDAIGRFVGAPLAADALTAALAVYEVVNDNMANAAAVYAAERGIDLRDYVLLAFGGAAPAHACDVARRLGIREVRVPGAAGVLSALGCLAAPVSFDFVFGYMRELSQVRWDVVERRYAELETEGRALMERAGIEGRLELRRTADMRYFGQRYEVNVALDGTFGPDRLEALEAAFRAAYRSHYGRDIPGVPVETVSWRLTVAAPAPSLDAAWARAAGGAVEADKGERPVCFPGAAASRACPVFERAALGAGHAIAGPAILEDPESTTVIPPGTTARIEGDGMVVVTLGEAAR